MLKSKLKSILIITLLFALCTTPFVYADEKDDYTLEETNDEVFIEEDGETTQNEENTKNSDVYLKGNNITIDYTIIGNAFILGKNVKITAPISGDVFIAAENVTIDSEGYINSNLFVTCNKLIVNSSVYDLYAVAKDITIGESGYVYRDIRSTSSNIDIFGTVGRNAYINCSKIALNSKDGSTGYATEDSGELSGIIYGNLEYTSSTELSNSEEYIKGETKHNQSSNIINKGNNIVNILISALSAIIFTAVIWLLLNWLSPKFATGARDLLTTKIGGVIGFGILGLILVPVISVILLVIPVTRSLSAILLSLYILLIVLSKSIFNITIAEVISEKINLENKWLHLVIASAVALVIYLLKLIPYVGNVVTVIWVIFGLGILTKKVLPNKKVEE